MRVLVLGRSSNAGGGPTHNAVLAHGLQARGHAVRIIFTHLGSPQNWVHRRLAEEGLLIEDLCYRFVEERYIRELSDLIDNECVDALVIDNPERLNELRSLSSRLQERLCKVTFVCHCHVTPHNILRPLRPYLHRVVCVSQASARLLEEFHPVVIRNAVPPPPSRGEDIRARLDIPEEAFVVGYLGRVDRNKSPEVLWNLLENTDWYCIIAGCGATAPPPELGSEVRDRARVFSEEIEYIGDWYRALDVFALTSAGEGFPLSVLEAFQCGCRVVSTPVSDLPEVFGGAIGFFDYGDAEGLRNEVKAAPSSDVGQRIVQEQFSVNGMVARYEEALRGS